MVQSLRGGGMLERLGMRMGEVVVEVDIVMKLGGLMGCCVSWETSWEERSGGSGRGRTPSDDESFCLTRKMDGFWRSCSSRGKDMTRRGRTITVKRS